MTNLIEENLSGGSRSVNIVGFAGALSSEATITQLTVSDAEGVWLSLDDIVLSWNRGALLRGQIDVQELSAARVSVLRAPIAEDTGPAPEATPFALPELPVGITLDALDIAEIALGEVFLGEAISVSLTGSAQLGGGEGTANVVATRLGDKAGVFEIDGSYANETRVLDLLLRLQEGADGIAARLLELPGRPAVGLEITGAAPLGDYAATLAVSTDGQDRLTGTFSLAEQTDAQVIALDIAGDISPLFAPAYGSFFGNAARLNAQVIRADDGRINVPMLALDAGRVALDGQLALDAQGWPELIDLRGGITALGDDPVLLPLSGPQTFVDGLDIAVQFDATVADAWRADITVDGFVRPGLKIDALALDGDGLLRAGAGAQTGAFTADVAYAASGLALDDAGAARALGDTVEGVLVASRLEGDVTNISQLTLQGAGIGVRANGTIAGPDTGFQTNAVIDAQIAGLARFSTITGQALDGGAQANIRAQVTPLDGLFDVELTAQTTDLSVGVAQADALLAGVGTVNAAAVRDTQGTRLTELRVQTDAAQITASANLTNAGASGRFVAQLSDVGLVVDGLTGPASLGGDGAIDEDGVVTFDVDGTGPAAVFSADGIMTPTEAGQTLNANLMADLSDLSRYAGLARRPLSGAASLQGRGVLLGDGSRFDVNLSGETRDVMSGEARVDPFLVGSGRFSAEVARTRADSFQVSNLAITTPAFSMTGDAAVALDGPIEADLALRVDDAALLDPTLSGPITAIVQASPAPDGATAAQLQVSGIGTNLDADIIVATAELGREITGEVAASVANLAAFAPLVGQALAGQVDATVSGSVLPDLSRFDAQVNLRSEDLAIGNATADPLLAGSGRINATVGLQDNVLGVRTLEVSTREVSIVGALNGAAGFGKGRFNASLRDVGVLTDQISGPIRATGAASLDEAGNWGIDATGTGPGGLGADIVGQIAQDGTLAINIDGSAPLALANAAIDPRRLSGLANFDLSVNGPAALSSLSGDITFSNGRLAAPNLGQALTEIGGQIAVNASVAQIDMTSRVEGGGQVAISGPLTLTDANQADVTITLRNVVLQDPELYRTRVSGDINIDGPLQGGARIAGRLELDETDVQVPSSAISSLGDLPDVIHLETSADVRRTLARAGLLQGGSEPAATGSRRAFPLDIVVNAPSRIFIRGRGLDAELGGRLTIGGTSADVIPVGQFSLVRGRIDILQQRFELTEGVASLQGDFVPFIRLVATTETDNGTVISIVVEGPAGEPEVSFL